MKKDNLLSQILAIFFGIFLSILLFEVFLRIYFYDGIFNEFTQVEKQEVDNVSEKFYGKIYTGSFYEGVDLEKIYFWNYTNPLIANKLDNLKQNVAIMGDSVAQGDTGGMSANKFSRVLDTIDSKRKYINFAQGGYNISQEFIEYREFILKEDFDAVVYVFYNDDIYYSSLIGDTIYTSPALIFPSKNGLTLEVFGNNFIDSTLSRSFLYKYFIKTFSGKIDFLEELNVLRTTDNREKYIDNLLERFYKYVDIMHAESKTRKQRFIVIISPSPSPEISSRFSGTNDFFYDLKFELNSQVSLTLKEKGVEVYNMQDYGIHKKDFFVDSCCHLNKEGHKFYAHFIKEILDNN